MARTPSTISSPGLRSYQAGSTVCAAAAACLVASIISDDGKQGGQSDNTKAGKPRVALAGLFTIKHRFQSVTERTDHLDA